MSEDTEGTSVSGRRPPFPREGSTPFTGSGSEQWPQPGSRPGDEDSVFCGPGPVGRIAKVPLPATPATVVIRILCDPSFSPALGQPV